MDKCWLIILVVILLLLLIWFLVKNKKPNNNELPIVQNVNLNKYQGLWYEVARLPAIFQQGCVDSTANYTLNSDNTVTVINRCIVNGKTIESRGIAKPNYRANQPGIYPGSLNVKFDSSPVAGEYNIIYLDPNYQYVVVGTKDRNNLWILSREPTLNDNIYLNLIELSEKLGYNTNNLIKN